MEEYPRSLAEFEAWFDTWSQVSARIPNMRWHITFLFPRTRTILAPNSSFNRAFRF